MERSPIGSLEVGLRFVHCSHCHLNVVHENVQFWIQSYSIGSSIQLCEQHFEHLNAVEFVTEGEILELFLVES